MYLYYDVIDDKKIISVVSETKLDYLGDNFVEKEEVPEVGFLYLDEKDNILVEEVKEDLEAKVKELEDKIEADKQTQTMANMAIFELYSEIENLKNEKVNK